MSRSLGAEVGADVMQSGLSCLAAAAYTAGTLI